MSAYLPIFNLWLKLGNQVWLLILRFLQLFSQISNFVLKLNMLVLKAYNLVIMLLKLLIELCIWGHKLVILFLYVNNIIWKLFVDLVSVLSVFFLFLLRFLSLGAKCAQLIFQVLQSLLIWLNLLILTIDDFLNLNNFFIDLFLIFVNFI